MGVYIKGMILPKDCRECLQGFAIQIGCNRMKDGKISYHNRREDCPLVEVKTPHGRLIDEGQIKTVYGEAMITRYQGYISRTEKITHTDAQTVIEAEVE